MFCPSVFAMLFTLMFKVVIFYVFLSLVGVLAVCIFDKFMTQLL